MAVPTVAVHRCASCHATFLPRPGPCPRCGSDRVEPVAVPARGTVLAATELSTPAAGWVAPHRLAVAEIADGIRVLCVVNRPLPAVGSTVALTQRGAQYQIG